MLHFKVNNIEISKVVQKTKNLIHLLLHLNVYIWSLNGENLQIMTEIAFC